MRCDGWVTERRDRLPLGEGWGEGVGADHVAAEAFYDAMDVPPELRD